MAITMMMTFFTLVSITGLLATRTDRRRTPNLITELHSWSWLALAILLVVATVPWLIKFDIPTIREAATRDTWGIWRFSFFLPIYFLLINVTSTPDFLMHSLFAIGPMYWGFTRLPRRTPLKRPAKVGFVAVAAAVIGIGMVAFTYEVMFFPASSMEPTIEIGNRGMVNRLDTTVERGDIVITRRESPLVFGPDRRVHRVIGVGGDTVAASGGQLLVNGEVPDYFIGLDKGGTQLRDFDEVRVPIGELFLMGDNYSGSLDSRKEGTVPANDVVGTVGRILRIGSSGT